jgi:hypothetical protein
VRRSVPVRADPDLDPGPDSSQMLHSALDIDLSRAESVSAFSGRKRPILRIAALFDAAPINAGSPQFGANSIGRDKREILAARRGTKAKHYCVRQSTGARGKPYKSDQNGRSKKEKWTKRGSTQLRLECDCGTRIH